MVSFDVISFIKNIPIIDTLNIIKDYVNNDDQFTIKTDGVAMGGRASSTVAEIYISGSQRNCNIYGTTPSKTLGTNCL